jgi:hypothetical protein
LDGTRRKITYVPERRPDFHRRRRLQEELGVGGDAEAATALKAAA